MNAKLKLMLSNVKKMVQLTGPPLEPRRPVGPGGPISP